MPFYQHPVFDWECKGKGFYIPAKFFFIFFEKISEAFGVKIKRFEELLLPVFWKRTAKVRVCLLPANFIAFFLSFCLLFFFATFRELPLFASGTQR
ncbi:MAG: hypothetical protein IAE96_00605 [Chitinophagaceae bacterium]|nr:hypothetical protein [Chitinophagaceae bacterium]